MGARSCKIRAVGNRKPQAFCYIRPITMSGPAFPEWVEPMAATLTQERFTGSDWIFERKLDGIRLLAFKNGSEVQLFSRTHYQQNIPSVAQSIAKLPHKQLILDGEIT